MSIALKEGHPAGTILGDWFIAKEGESFVVKRMLTLPGGTRTAQRAPRKAYSKLLSYTAAEQERHANNPGVPIPPPRALEDYVIRLNGKDPKAERIKEIVRYRHAWIDEALLMQYRQDAIYSAVSDRTNADALFNYLNRYALDWFINKRNLKSPLQWKQHEKEWGMYLMNRKIDQREMKDELCIFVDKHEDKFLTPKNRQLSAKVLGYVVFEMNRFISYLYQKRRSEFEDELVKMEPWGNDLLKNYEAEWRIKNPARPTRYIKADHWQLLVSAMEKKDIPWRHQVHLAHDFGLRRNETMGLDYPGSARSTHLFLNKQLKKGVDAEAGGERSFKPLKGREGHRKVEYWFTDAKTTAARIKAMLGNHLPHPDTISKGFRELCADLKLPDYWFHDLRRTFITDAIRRGVKPDDLRLAVGHKDIRTTMQFYVMDGRDLEDDIIVLEDDDDEAA